MKTLAFFDVRNSESGNTRFTLDEDGKKYMVNERFGRFLGYVNSGTYPTDDYVTDSVEEALKWLTSARETQMRVAEFMPGATSEITDILVKVKDVKRIMEKIAS